MLEFFLKKKKEIMMHVIIAEQCEVTIDIPIELSKNITRHTLNFIVNTL